MNEPTSWLVTDHAITIHINDDLRTVKVEDPKYDLALEAIKSQNWDELEKLLKPEAKLEEVTNGACRVENGQVYIKYEDGGEYCPPSLLNRTILSYLDKGLPFDRLIKFAKKLNENPSFKSVRDLFEFITHNQLTITEDGDFIAYKSVRSDFKDMYSGTFDNSPGASPKMRRNEVDEDSQKTCSNGLHVAAYHYAHVIYNGEITLCVSVNPKDVVAVPEDYNNEKMRVCEYKVLGVTKGEFVGEAFDPDFLKEKRLNDLENCDDDYDDEDDDYDDDDYDDTEDSDEDLEEVLEGDSDEDLEEDSNHCHCKCGCGGTFDSVPEEDPKEEDSAEEAPVGDDWSFDKFVDSDF